MEHGAANGYGALGDLYSDDWYDWQYRDSLASARVYVPFLIRYLSPKSVLDVGCGRGAWLKAWKECGAEELHGLDGHWNSAEKMLEPEIHFRQIDLNKAFALERGRVDLAMSLEVAEHLEPSSAEQFVASLTKASDVVLFSAAFSHQGGTNHINERPHSYWADIFRRAGYAVFDPLRGTFWNDSRVCWWYRQNTFLYVRKDCENYRALTARGLAPLESFAFMDCVHPVLFEMIHSARSAAEKRQLTLREHIKQLPGSVKRAVQHRLKRARGN